MCLTFTDFSLFDRLADTLFQLKVRRLREIFQPVYRPLHNFTYDVFVNFIATTFPVYNQTVGKILKEVWEGGEGTTSKSQKGSKTSIVSPLYLNAENWDLITKTLKSI